jgi:hypothetical protein
MKFKWFAHGLLVLAIPMVSIAAPTETGKTNPLSNVVILVVRHAEKPIAGTSLSPAGEARAKAYGEYFKRLTVDGRPFRPDYLFAASDSTNSHRPRLTIEPVAAQLGITIDQRFSDQQFQGLAREILNRPHGTNILICWHHGKIPQLLRALGADPKKLLPNGKWPDEVFDWLIELRYDGSGHLMASQRIKEHLGTVDLLQPTRDGTGPALASRRLKE